MSLVYLVAGEASGDVLGARLMAALATARPELEFAGVGGPRMMLQGLASLFPMEELALMGLAEVLPRLFSVRRRLHETTGDIARRRPDVVVTIDSPGFTLRLLRRIRPLGIPRAHYVAPQVWAWREGRVRKFPGLWESLLCLLPFEPAFFAGHGLPACFVGHPVLESGADRGDGARFLALHGLAPTARVLVMMPGSRGSEVARHLPIFGAALERLARRVPGLVPVMPVNADLAPRVGAAVADWPLRPLLLTDAGTKYDAFAAAAAALTKSGTSTLELALAGVPMVVTYRFHPLTAALARRLVRVRYASILNLLAEREVIPELLQERASGEEIAAALLPLLEGERAAAAQREAFAPLLARLRAPEGMPSQAAA
ncbi:MAG: lipid-A-disaccharide synthase, partial [Acetobacteraceae bacterium]